jgi:carotenoid cleavage dioxygenase-like enzyme
MDVGVKTWHPQKGIVRFDCETGRLEQWMRTSYQLQTLWRTHVGSCQGGQRRQRCWVYLVGIIETSDIVIMKATNDIAARPITRIALGMVVPIVLFGCFAATEAAPRPWILSREDRN